MAKREGETHFATKRRGQSLTYAPKQSQNPRLARNIFLENHPVNQLTRIAFSRPVIVFTKVALI